MAEKILLHPDYLPFGLAVASEQDRVGDPIHKFGSNAAVSTSTDTIWAQGGDYKWQAAATVVSVTSSDANDDSVGTGARTVVLEGLDTNYAEISETVIMDGTTVVDTTASFLRLHRMYVATAGTGLTNAGTIYAAVTGDVYTTPGVPDTTVDIMSTIAIGEGQTLQAFYTVPAGKTGYLLYLAASTADAVNAGTIVLRTRAFGGAFRTQNRFVVLEGSFAHIYEIPVRYPEKTDLEVIGTSGASTIDVAANFDLILLNN